MAMAISSSTTTYNMAPAAKLSKYVMPGLPAVRQESSLLLQSVQRLLKVHLPEMPFSYFHPLPDQFQHEDVESNDQVRVKTIYQSRTQQTESVYLQK